MPGAEQSQIRIGWVGVPRSTPDYFPLQVLNTILGGSFTSRLNQNLREEHGYSYGASSRFDMRLSAGPVPGRRRRADRQDRRSAARVLQRAERHRRAGQRRRAGQGEELRRARLPERVRDDRRPVRRSSRSWSSTSCPTTTSRATSPNIQAVTAAAVQKAAATYIQPEQVRGGGGRRPQGDRAGHPRAEPGAGARDARGRGARAMSVGVGARRAARLLGPRARASGARGSRRIPRGSTCRFRPAARFPTRRSLLDHVFLVERRHLSRLEGGTPPEQTGIAPGDWHGAVRVRRPGAGRLPPATSTDLDDADGRRARSRSRSRAGAFTMSRRKLADAHRAARGAALGADGLRRAQRRPRAARRARPLLLPGDRLMDTYYHPKDLGRFADMGKDAPELWQKFLGVVHRRLQGGRADRAREGAHRAGRRARRAVPVLHRRLLHRMPGKGLDAGADDRGRARRGRHSRRRVAGPRRADAEPRGQAVDVSRTVGARAAAGVWSSIRWRYSHCSTRSSPLADAATQRAMLDALPLDACVRRERWPRRATSRCDADGVDVLQVNVGKRCNQACHHCHVDAGPDRTEVMPDDVVDACLRVSRRERHSDARHHRRRAGAAPAVPRHRARARAPPAGT